MTLMSCPVPTCFTPFFDNPRLAGFFIIKILNCLYMMDWVIRSINADDTERIGSIFAGLIRPPEIIELRADLGGGKTTFTKGFVRGLGSVDRVNSPTFTLNKIYKAGHLEIHHFDFYRLDTPGVIADQLEEALQNPRVITIVEWADIVKGVLPDERITIEFKPVADNEDERVVTFEIPPSKMEIIEKLRNKLSETQP
jgi:tRNA threonylcarbamoyladenosine biosynthesis protein TsaE